MSESNEVEKVVARKLQDADLIYFTNLANKTDVGVDITLFVKGTLLSGTIISGKKYFEAMHQKFESYGDKSYGFLLKDYFSKLLNMYTPGYVDNGEGEEVENKDIPLNFMHLENVSLQSGGGVFNNINGGLLRLKIEEIDGYIFGSTSNVN